MLALGKDGQGYLLDQNNLGGVGGSLAVETVSRRPIRTAPAAYEVGADLYVALQGAGAHCPSGQTENQLTGLKVRAGDRPAITPACCGDQSGTGCPTVRAR